MEGWIKLHRKFVEWEWFNVDEMVKLFIYLLLTANHETTKWRGIEIKRGQLLTGRKSLHDKTKISEQTLRTCLSRLEKTGEINLQSTNRFTIITISNYDSYQSNQPTTNQLTNQQLTSDQPTTNQQLTTNKNDKKEKNEKNIINKDEILVNSLEIKNGYSEVFLRWLKYKRSRNESYKNKDSAFLAYEKLYKLSSGDHNKAIQIIENSMANNWAGLFELKDNGKKINDYGTEGMFK